MHGRYRVVTEIGRGVFSAVLGCIDVKGANRAVAIKVIKNNDTMRKAAEKEVDILTRVTKDDPHGKKHCVGLVRRPGLPLSPMIICAVSSCQNPCEICAYLSVLVCARCRLQVLNTGSTFAWSSSATRWTCERSSRSLVVG